MGFPERNSAALDAALWMQAQLKEDGEVYQGDPVDAIGMVFREELTYENDNENPGIRRDGLREFRRLTEPDVVWGRSEFCWRVREAHEIGEKRAVE